MGALVEDLKPVASESLDTFGDIADAAAEKLRDRGLKPEDLANPNIVTSPASVADMNNRNRDRTSNLQALRSKPMIARLVIADEDDNRETIFVAPNAEVSLAGKKICSYLANRGKGKLLALDVGKDADCELPGGVRNFTVLEKLTFEPRYDGEWDAIPAIQFREGAAPLTIKSLRELLRDVGIDPDDFDLDGWVSEDAGDSNVVEGIQRAIRTAMELRLNPFLDRQQEEIFRLPLVGEQIALLGPPGTGKTTTLVRRLRQKIDLAALDPDDADQVDSPDAAGRSHPESWMMFTPTELLRQYVREALGKEGMSVHDGQIKTWDSYRIELGRKLRVLRTVGGGGGLIPNPDDDQLHREAFAQTRHWFDDFDAFQRGMFVEELQQEAERIAKSDDDAAAALGRQAHKAIERADGNVTRLLAELLSIRDRLRNQANALRSQTQDNLKAIVGDMRREDPAILDDLQAFVLALLAEQEEDEDQQNDDDDDDDVVITAKARGRREVLDVFLKALRTTAIARANSRKPASTSRAGRILAWLDQRGAPVPEMRDLGKTLLIQRALTRIARAPADYLAKMPLRYRAFRKQARADGKWYRDVKKIPAANAHPAEVDCLLLGMIRGAAEMENDRVVTQRMGENIPSLLIDIARERRNQILVDEATDFSPVQLACLYALTDPRTHSLFLSGDFNQRLTLWGTRSESDLDFVCASFTKKKVSITYRQSEKLARYAALLARGMDTEAPATLPEYSENVGVDPVAGLEIADVEQKAAWLGARVREIVSANGGTMPTIAVLMPDEEELDALADALSEELRSVSIGAVAYRKGVARGLDQDVRIFSVEHIKGLEFEAVFFLDVDRLADENQELFDRYIYVGATRAATYLGVATGESRLPKKLSEPDLVYGSSWEE